MAELVNYCLPNFGNCVPALGDLVPNAKEAIEYFLSFQWINVKPDGGKNFKQNPFFACWYNIPLCLAVCCVPCCNVAVFLRSMEKMSGKSCESQCLTCCILNCCCCMYNCYYAKKRGEMRKKYGLDGCGAWDCFGCCCFGPCLMCQDANEVQSNIPFCSAQQAEAMRNKVMPS
mmetsp:Transcript_4692/g.10161  ORF Transcript_4692/g.10161 Transcript_4692/m.10161 type:complete len:173 (-) Transcript_4692:332-850(-)